MTMTTEQTDRRRGQTPKQRIDFSVEEIMKASLAGRLTKEHEAILLANTTNSTYQIMADELGLTSLGTVKSRLNRAREVMNKAVAVHPNGAPKWSVDGRTLLDEKGNRSTFDDVEK